MPRRGSSHGRRLPQTLSARVGAWLKPLSKPPATVNKRLDPFIYALRLFGEIAAHKDPPNVGEAENHYRQALALAGALGMRPLIAHCHVGLGKLYRRIGSRQQAEEHLTTATAMMREMEMGVWPEQPEAELRELQ